MSNSYTLYNNDLRKARITNLLNTTKGRDLEIIIKKDKANNLSSFFMGVSMNVFMSDSLKINSIKVQNGIVKPMKNNTINQLLQRFTIKKAYIATADKNTIEGIRTFYNVLEDKPKLIFDISQESNIQKIFYKDVEPLSEENKNIEPVENTEPAEMISTDSAHEQPTKILESQSFEPVQMNNIEQEDNFIKEVSVENTPEKKENQGSVKIIIIFAIAGLLITIISIFIGVKIMNM